MGDKVRKITSLLLSCGLVLCFLIACEKQAYAYVDPGSGLFLLQGIGAAFMGFIYVVRRKLKLIGKRDLASANASGAKLESVGKQGE
jgi:hypothetical protein